MFLQGHVSVNHRQTKINKVDAVAVEARPMKVVEVAEAGAEVEAEVEAEAEAEEEEGVEAEKVEEEGAEEVMPGEMAVQQHLLRDQM